MATAGTITNIQIVTREINGVSIRGYISDSGLFVPLQPIPTPEPTPAPTPAPTPLPIPPPTRDGVLGLPAKEQQLWPAVITSTNAPACNAILRENAPVAECPNILTYSPSCRGVRSHQKVCVGGGNVATTTKK